LSEPVIAEFVMPSLKRRLASMVYESLLLGALLFIAGYLVVGLRPQDHPGLFRFYLLFVCGLYFVWFWRHGGQTLAMRTWRIRLVDASGRQVSRRVAWLRYGYAVAGLLALGLGFLWALWDRDKMFLHDRLAGTRLKLLAERDKQSTA
jgi:uncharacterized RDD family membrane protein YckC